MSTFLVIFFLIKGERNKHFFIILIIPQCTELSLSFDIMKKKQEISMMEFILTSHLISFIETCRS